MWVIFRQNCVNFTLFFYYTQIDVNALNINVPHINLWTPPHDASPKRVLKINFFWSFILRIRVLFFIFKDLTSTTQKFIIYFFEGKIK